jgi:hypothetical protein
VDNTCVGCTELAELWSHCGLWQNRWAEMVFNVIKCAGFIETLRDGSLKKCSAVVDIAMLWKSLYTVFIWV